MEAIMFKLNQITFSVMLFLLVPVCTLADFRLVSEKDHKNYLQFFPNTNDPNLSKLKEGITFYTDKEMPKAYQFNGGVHSPSYNISAVQPQEKIGNANVEFPWGTPMGLHSAENTKSIKFVKFPLGKAIAYWRENTSRDVIYKWEYPVGTVFGEILLITDPDRYDHTFLVRTRTRQEDSWTVNAYAPFSNPKELSAHIRSKEYNWKINSDVKTFLEHLEKDDTQFEEVRFLVSKHPNKTVFNREAVRDDLLAIPQPLVEKLLKVPFRSILGLHWRSNKQGECFAPSTESRFHIVPKNYTGYLVETSATSCTTCHDSVGVHARDFDANRDWYGHVRGSDNLAKGGGIFSFHIFEPSCISYNGFIVHPVLRGELVNAGFLKFRN